MKKLWLNYILAYLMWFIFFIMGVLFILISRQGILGLLYFGYARDNFQRAMVAQFLDKVYLVAVGLTLLVLMIVIESYFKTGAQKGTLLVRISRVMGLEFLCLFGAHLLMVILGLLGSLSILQILLMAIELLGGVVLVWVWRRHRAKTEIQQK